LRGKAREGEDSSGGRRKGGESGGRKSFHMERVFLGSKGLDDPLVICPFAITSPQKGSPIPSRRGCGRG